ncbi:MAG TPA: transcriptional regulator [Longimicrobiales bacterium]|nr:transcriptional regulator [Longimicrobiales bacterium]
MAAERSAARRRQDRAAPRTTGLGAVQGKASEAGPLELDQLIHERVRLGIVSALAVNGSLTFTDLRDLLGTTDGNLSAHARRLEDAGYVVCRKSFDGRTPKTEYALTQRGRRELDAYLDHMEAIIEATRE